MTVTTVCTSRGGVYTRRTRRVNPTRLMEAERLSALHSQTLGTRTLDILHVAAALVLGLAEVLTFDTRQATLAKAAGLKVPRL